MDTCHPVRGQEPGLDCTGCSLNPWPTRPEPPSLKLATGLGESAPLSPFVKTQRVWLNLSVWSLHWTVGKFYRKQQTANQNVTGILSATSILFSNFLWAFNFLQTISSPLLRSLIRVHPSPKKTVLANIFLPKLLSVHFSEVTSVDGSNVLEQYIFLPGLLFWCKIYFFWNFCQTTSLDDCQGLHMHEVETPITIFQEFRILEFCSQN